MADNRVSFARKKRAFQRGFANAFSIFPDVDRTQFFSSRRRNIRKASVEASWQEVGEALTEALEAFDRMIKEEKEFSDEDKSAHG